jgi:hypothetical protein
MMEMFRLGLTDNPTSPFPLNDKLEPFRNNPVLESDTTEIPGDPEVPDDANKRTVLVSWVSEICTRSTPDVLTPRVSAETRYKPDPASPWNAYVGKLEDPVEDVISPVLEANMVDVSWTKSPDVPSNLATAVSVEDAAPSTHAANSMTDPPVVIPFSVPPSVYREMPPVVAPVGIPDASRINVTP